MISYLIRYCFFPRGKSGDAQKDLYLRGIDNNTGRDVDFEEILESARQKMWQLKIFKSSGTTRLARLSGGYGAGTDNEEPECTRGIFDVTRINFVHTGIWEKPVSSVNFKLDKCTEKPGREECEIKIVRIF